MLSTDLLFWIQVVAWAGLGLSLITALPRWAIIITGVAWLVLALNLLAQKF